MKLRWCLSRAGEVIKLTRGPYPGDRPWVGNLDRITDEEVRFDGGDERLVLARKLRGMRLDMRRFARAEGFKL